MASSDESMIADRCAAIVSGSPNGVAGEVYEACRRTPGAGQPRDGLPIRYDFGTRMKVRKVHAMINRIWERV
jgi:hypothetical protein